MFIVPPELYTNVFLLQQPLCFAPPPLGRELQDWAAQMKPYLMSLGVFHVMSGKDDQDSETFDAHNEKAIGTLVLKMAPTLRQKWQNVEMAKDIWEGLKNQFSTPSLAIVYGEFKKLMDSQIPAGNHPAPSFAAINNHFALLQEYNYPIDERTQVMIVMAKLPPYMDVMTQLLNTKSVESTKDIEIDETVTTTIGEGESAVTSRTTKKVKKLTPPPVTLVELEKQTVLAWQQHAQHRTHKLQQANKVTAVKKKGPDPQFQQQQQQPQQQAGGSGSGQADQKKKSRRGKHSEAGQDKQERYQKRQYANEIPAASFTFTSSAPVVLSPAAPPTYATTVDPRAFLHTTGSTSYGEPAFPHTKNMISLAHHLGLTPMQETVRTLDPVANRHIDWTGGVPTNKRPRLEERIEDLSEPVADPSNHCRTDTFGGESSSPRDPAKVSNIHTWDKDDEYEVDVFGSEKDLVDDYYINQDDIFDMDQFLGTAEDFGFNIEEWSVFLNSLSPDADAQSFLPQKNNVFSFLSVVDSAKDTNISTFFHSFCDDCTKVSGKGKERQHDHSIPPDMWLLNSGASVHFTFNKKDFVEYVEYASPRYSQTANGKAPILGEGTVIIDYKGSSVRLSPVIYMPTCNLKLISMGTLLKDNCLTINAGPSHIDFFDKCAKRIILSFHSHGADTMFWMRAPTMSPQATHSLASVDYELLYLRLGHPSKDVLRAARKHLKDFPDVKILTQDSICPGCQLGKQPNRSFPHTEHRATAPFELIHSDLKSFEVESYHKYKYAIVYYDDFTSMAWVVCLRSKDQAFAATKQFVSYVRTQYNAFIKGWRSDAGSKFMSKAFRDYLKDNGIHIHQSAPYAHQQNSHAERLIRTLMDKAQAMRLHACLPDSYWEFAILHAAHVYNMTPMNQLNWRTPLELLKGEKPSVSHLRVFGCGAYMHLPDETRKGKLQPKSQLMVYLGVSAGSEHNYLFMRPNNALHTSAHAIFDEYLFPKCSGTQPHKPVSHAPRNPHKDTPNGHESDSEVIDDDVALPAPPCQPPVVQPPVRTPSPAPPVTPPPLPPAPVTPPRSHPPPIGPPPLRCGERECRAPFRPGNIYGECGQSSKQIREIEQESTWK
jgi:hypothetical protein